MYDRLFGKILIDRGLITREQLDEAIAVREKLLAVGLDRRIGEILVNRRLISQDVADEIGNQQKTVDSGGGESVLGRLAVQTGLISQAQLNRALELQRAWFQESGVAPTLGYILVEEGLLTVQQLDALIAVQNRVKTRRRAAGAGAGVGGERMPGARSADPTFNDLHDDGGARPSVNYHVRTEFSSPDGTRGPTERVLTGAALRAMIRKGEIGPSVLVRREDQTAVRPLGDYTEFNTAFEQNDRYRASTMRRVQTTPQNRAGRTWRRVSMVLLLALALAACFWLGRESAPGSGRGQSRAIWTAGDLIRYLPENAAESVAARAWVDRYMARRDSGEKPDDLRQFMAGLGLELTTTMTGQHCYVPLDEAAMLREWAARGEFVDARLQPFEFPDGIVYGVPDQHGVRLADGGLLALGPSRLRQQQSAWQALTGARAAILGDQDPREQVARHLDAAARLDESGWFRHARRERLAAWQVLPEDPRVREQLGFIAPGEDPDDPTGSRVLPQHELPSVPMPDPPAQQLPAPWTAPGMAGAAADPYPQPPPWARLTPFIGLEDVIDAPEPVADPEGIRLRDGEVEYLGYWLPRGPFRRWWPTARQPSRLVLRSGVAGKAEVWTDLPQFRQDIVNLVRDLFPRLVEYLRLHLRDVLPWDSVGTPDESRMPRTVLSAPCFLVVVGPGERLPLWVARGVKGRPTRVELTDMRSLDALVPAIARGCFSAFIAASWGPGLPAWMRAAMADLLAARFVSDSLLDEWRLLDDKLFAERLITPLPDAGSGNDPLPALFSGNCESPVERATASGIYAELLERSHTGTDQRLARLHDAVLADDRLALEDETRRLVLGIDAVPWAAHLRDRAMKLSERLGPILPLHSANTRFLSAAHLELLQRTDGHTRFYSHVTGFAAADTTPGRLDDSTIPGQVAASYSLRELLGLAALAARLRTISLGGPGATADMLELRTLFGATGRPDWVTATTAALDQLPDPDRRTGNGSDDENDNDGGSR